MPREVRVAIVDDHVIVRMGLRQFFAQHPAIKVVGESSSGRGAVELVRKIPMDVLLLDISMPDQSGIDSITMIRAKAPQVGILVLTAHPLERFAVKMLRLGASGYLNKQCEPEEILEAVRVIGAGRRYIQPELGDLLASSFYTVKARPPHESLNERELQIFLKLSQGVPSGAIADELSLSPKTVSTYRFKLMSKLDLRSNSDLTYYAIKHRLMQ